MDWDNHTTSFLFSAYKAGLSHADLDMMTVGGIMDFIEEWVDRNTPDSEKTRQAKQSDFDSF